MCLAIIERALQLLRTQPDLAKSEGDLNRCLYFQLLKASRELHPLDPVAPVSECNNQPDPDDEARVKREGKRPDFQWVYIDIYEPDPERSSRQFTVECKRLGTPDRGDWVFNVNYVTNGMCRFNDPLWGYGQRFESGAMIGYWQSMELEHVLQEVNQEAANNSLPQIVPFGQPIKNGHRSQHTFARHFEITPFRLQHLWIDLRTTPEFE